MNGSFKKKLIHPSFISSNCRFYFQHCILLTSLGIESCSRSARESILRKDRWRWYSRRFCSLDHHRLVPLPQYLFCSTHVHGSHGVFPPRSSSLMVLQLFFCQHLSNPPRFLLKGWSSRTSSSRLMGTSSLRSVSLQLLLKQLK